MVGLVSRNAQRCQHRSPTHRCQQRSSTRRCRTRLHSHAFGDVVSQMHQLFKLCHVCLMFAKRFRILCSGNESTQHGKHAKFCEHDNPQTQTLEILTCWTCRGRGCDCVCSRVPACVYVFSSFLFISTVPNRFHSFWKISQMSHMTSMSIFFMFAKRFRIACCRYEKHNMEQVRKPTNN